MTDESKQNETESLGPDGDFVEQALDRMGQARKRAGTPAAPDRVGPYKILQLLGEGGMGYVYLAEQAEPVRRRVALKIIKPGMDSKAVLARFEAEKQALALMDHPHVAKVFDGGSTEQGRPYFVMEHVSGVPITEHCDRQKLNIEERLQLFMQVCEAVQHAHQKGVIHRDIKPSNILVVPGGTEGRRDEGTRGRRGPLAFQRSSTSGWPRPSASASPNGPSSPSRAS